MKYKKSIAKFLFEKLIKDMYLKHRYLVENNKYGWRNILSTVSDIGPIFHMDFSENYSERQNLKHSLLIFRSNNSLCIAKLNMIVTLRQRNRHIRITITYLMT